MIKIRLFSLLILIAAFLLNNINYGFTIIDNADGNVYLYWRGKDRGNSKLLSVGAFNMKKGDKQRIDIKNDYVIVNAVNTFEGLKNEENPNAYTAEFNSDNLFNLGYSKEQLNSPDFIINLGIDYGELKFKTPA